MKSLIPHSSGLASIFGKLFASGLLATAMAAGAFAQHGGAGGHVATGGAGHAGASHPAASRPIASRPVTPIRPPIGPGAGTRSFLVRPPITPAPAARGFIVGYPYPRLPLRPRRPFIPIIPVPPPGFWGFGFPFLGFGWASGPWAWCDPFWGWGYAYGCTGVSGYDYGSGSNAVFSPYSLGPGNPQSQPQLDVQSWPVYYGEPNSQFVQLYMNDGSVYNVTDYWLVNGELHYKMIEDHGTKVGEHTIDFSQLDLQKTIDVNTDRGFRIVLRNEPLEQYLKDHAGDGEPGSPATPPAEPPAQP